MDYQQIYMNKRTDLFFSLTPVYRLTVENKTSDPPVPEKFTSMQG
jgi:hypothetical protein